MTQLSPAQAKQRLIEGNHRFISGVKSVESLLAHSKMADLATNGQKPFAVILTCSDSRSPVEMVFDQGIGDLFVVRVAGNVVAPSLLASMEFAVANFGSATIMVLGHTQCGAIDATVKHIQNPKVALPSVHLEELVGRIRPAVERTLMEHNVEEDDFLQRSTEQNILRSASLITEQSRIIRQAIEKGLLSIEPAILDIRTGKVRFLA